jgi:hypothetical protein
MKRTIAAALALAMLAGLSACGPEGQPNFQGAAGGFDKMGVREEMVAMEPAPAEAAAPPMADGAAAPMPPPPPGQPPGPDQPGTPPGAPMLAYAYDYGVEAPPKAVPSLMKLHEKSCTDAGANRCQVLGASTNSYGEYDVRARLEIRGEPRWLATFREQIEADAEKAGGDLKSKQTTTEDLTRAIIDTEARMKAQSTLRDRLQALLASRPGKLGELLEVERELARVQADIDSIQSNLAVMKTRVAMSVLTIEYKSSGAPVTDTTLEPIKNAFTDFLKIVVQGFAAMLYFVAAVLPFALVIALVAWLVMRWRAKRRAARLVETAPPSP